MDDSVKKFVIYKVSHRETGKSYIGQTTKGLKKRWKQHIFAAKKSNTLTVFHKAIKDFGPDAFDVVELCATTRALELDELEKEAIKAHGTLYPNGYNSTIGGGCHSFSFQSEEDRKLIKLINFMKENGILSLKMDKDKVDISIAPTHMFPVEQSVPQESSPDVPQQQTFTDQEILLWSSPGHHPELEEIN